jgi:hypothetical protein
VCSSDLAAEPPPEDDVRYNFPGDLKWLEPNEAAVNAKLVEWQWISAGQTFRDLPADKIAKIKARTGQFCASCGIPVPTPEVAHV